MEEMKARGRSGRRVRVILVIFAAIVLGGVWYALHVLGTGDDRLIHWIATKWPARVKADALVREALSSDPATRKAGEAGIAALHRSRDIKALVEAIADSGILEATRSDPNGEGYRLCGLVGAIGAPAAQPLIDLCCADLQEDIFLHSIEKWFPLYTGRRSFRKAIAVDVAGEALARMGEPLVEPLVAMANSKSQMDLWAAMNLFRWIKEPTATTALIRIVNTTTGATQHDALEMLSERASPPAAETFAAIAPQWQRYYDNGYVAIIGLGRLKDPRAIPALCRMLKDTRNPNRAYAASFLGGYADPQVETDLIGVLSDTDGNVREAAATSLGKMASRSALAPLAPLQSDGYPTVRTAARDAIVQIKARAASKSLSP